MKIIARIKAAYIRAKGKRQSDSKIAKDLGENDLGMVSIRGRTNSEETMVEIAQNEECVIKREKIELLDLPVELLTLVAMYSGFVPALNLRQTNKRFNLLLSRKASWADFYSLSPDVIHSKVLIETKLHHFDQIIFASWPINGKGTPCVVHRTFHERYDFLGGISLLSKPNGMCHIKFFEHRESLPCYVADLKKRIAQGSLPPVMISEESPIGGLRVAHSCDQCSEYDRQEVVQTNFVHQSFSLQQISHLYDLGPKRKLTVEVESIIGVFGFESGPIVTSKIWKINEKVISPALLTLYLKYVNSE